MKTITIFKPITIPACNIRSKNGNRGRKPVTLQAGEYPLISEFQAMDMVYFGDECAEVSHDNHTFTFIKRYNKPKED
jgi:hypothetical protein